MSKVWQTFCGYVWWTYKRGSIHYDIMVSIILLFIFLAPRWINFNDKPTEHIPHPTEVLVAPDGDGFVYQINASAVSGKDDDAIRRDLLRVIEPIAGEIDVQHYALIKDANGHLVFYKVWVSRPYR